MGVRAVLVRLDNDECYMTLRQYVAVNEVYYRYVGLVHMDGAYYATVECEGGYFVSRLIDVVGDRVSYLDDYPLIWTEYGYMIDGAEYFDSIEDCYAHAQCN